MSSREEFMRQMGLTATDLKQPHEPFKAPARPGGARREDETTFSPPRTTSKPNVTTTAPSTVNAGTPSATSQSKADFLRSLGIDNYDGDATAVQSTRPAPGAARNATGSQEFPKAEMSRQPPSSGSFSRRRVAEEDDESTFRGAYTPKFREPEREDLTLGRKQGVERAPVNPTLEAELLGLNDSAGSEEVKAMGNKFFQAGDYRKAVRLYTRAIEMNGANAALYSNRSAAYLLGAKQMGIDTRSMALRDADKTIKLKPTWFKGFSRRGDALFKMERYDEAHEAYRSALELDPGNAGIIHSMNELQPFVATKRTNESASWEAPGNSIIKSSVVSQSAMKSTTKSAHELLDEFHQERSRTTPQLGLGGSDYKAKQLERFRNRSTDSGEFTASQEEPMAKPAQSTPLQRRDIPSEFSSDAAREYQNALLESYRQKKAQARR